MGLIWASFPFLLCALYALHGVFAKVVEDTVAEMFVYLMEKSCIIWMTVMYIVLPALSLVAVSYDWSFSETTIDKTIPTGYYMQFYANLFCLEIIDCAAIADATFMISMFIAVRLLLYGSNDKNKKFLEFRNIVLLCTSHIILAEVMACCGVIVMFVIFSIILFEFAESGFFSPNGYAKFLIIAVVLVKMYIGVKMIVASTEKRYGKIQQLLQDRVFDDDDDAMNQTGKNESEQIR